MECQGLTIAQIASHRFELQVDLLQRCCCPLLNRALDKLAICRDAHLAGKVDLVPRDDAAGEDWAGYRCVSSVVEAGGIASIRRLDTRIASQALVRRLGSSSGYEVV